MQKTCIVIPCYNEEIRLPVKDFIDYFNASEGICFCFVNDGSTDNTLKVLNDLARGKEERIKVLDLSVNQGKAEAIRQGIFNVLKWKDFDHIGYFDADFSTPLFEVENLVKALKQSKSIIAFGARVKLLGRTIERTSMRHYSGRVFSTFASIILSLPVYDTQCGAKVLKAEVAEELFSKKFMSMWLFDVELFARIVNKYGAKRSETLMVEVPLSQWIEKGGSKLKFIHMLKVPFELSKILIAYRIKR